MSELFSKEKIPVRHLQQQVMSKGGASSLWMALTVEISDASALQKLLSALAQVPGVERAVRM